MAKSTEPVRNFMLRLAYFRVPTKLLVTVIRSSPTQGFCRLGCKDALTTRFIKNVNFLYDV